jgi:hypothetical protein
MRFADDNGTVTQVFCRRRLIYPVSLPRKAVTCGLVVAMTIATTGKAVCSLYNKCVLSAENTFYTAMTIATTGKAATKSIREGN